MYGACATALERFELDEWVEVMHYMYLPVKFPGMNIRLPERLEFLRRVVGSVTVQEDAYEKYVYVTARRGFATPDNPLNRPGWHCDGFGTEDMNYVWYDRWPTRIAVGSFKDISDDHVVSMQQFEDQVDGMLIECLPPKWLLRFNPYVVHTTPIIPKVGGFRSFLKISVSEHEYNLEGNSHNHLFDYDWKMWPRSAVRNDPAYGQGDYYLS